MRLPSPENLWERHERYVLNVFLLALTKLIDEDALPEGEIELNNLLYVNVRQVWCDLPLNDKPSSFSLIPNSENPPRKISEIGQEWTRKKPDFLWSLSDSQERDSLKAIRNYTIECKRLTKKTASGWDFIKEYITSGIFRFISKEHSYGIGTISGAMVGYIQNMKHNVALEQVNTAILKTKGSVIPEINFSRTRQTMSRIKKGNHTLNRKEVNPSIFDLRHIWIEMSN
jgi:hypothetical protein